MSPVTDLEAEFAFQIRAHCLPKPVREFTFAKRDLQRNWRADFCWPDLRVIAEVEGGVWTKGRHTRPTGFINDCEKLNAAAELGYRVLRFPESTIKDGTAVQQLARVLADAEAAA